MFDYTDSAVVMSHIILLALPAIRGYQFQREYHLTFNQVILTYLFTYSMEPGPSWEANRFAASQKIPRILWNPKVHYRIQKCPLPALSWPRSIQSIPHILLLEVTS
jgi:hypothetical protein